MKRVIFASHHDATIPPNMPPPAHSTNAVRLCRSPDCSDRSLIPDTASSKRKYSTPTSSPHRNFFRSMRLPQYHPPAKHDSTYVSKIPISVFPISGCIFKNTKAIRSKNTTVTRKASKRPRSTAPAALPPIRNCSTHHPSFLPVYAPDPADRSTPAPKSCCILYRFIV